MAHLAVLFLKMLAVHCLADYPLQGDFLAKAKNHREPMPGVPWYQALAAHSIIQGAGVWLVTGHLWLGVAETVAHGWTDWLKSEGVINYNTDQALHVGCKAVWAACLSLSLM